MQIGQQEAHMSLCARVDGRLTDSQEASPHLIDATAVAN